MFFIDRPKDIKMTLKVGIDQQGKDQVARKYCWTLPSREKAIKNISDFG